MGNLYEGGFFAAFQYWVRYYDPILKKSAITNQCPQKWEYYSKDPDGNYLSIYEDQNYRKFEGSSNEAKGYGCTSAISPLDLAIRDMFRNRSNQNPRIMYLDIETRTGTVVKGFPSPDKALEPVSLIQFLDSETQIVHLIGDKEFYYKDWYLKQPHHQGKEVQYWHCNTEEQMFNLFFNFIEDICPAVVYAWNGEGFDFPYLYNRCVRLGLDPSRFSPFWRQFGSGSCDKGLVQVRENSFANQYTFDLQVGGCYYMDIKKLYQKIVLAPRPSYALNAIAEIEVKAQKIDHSEFRSFDDFYLGNYEKPANPTPEQQETLCYKMTEKGLPLGEIKKAGHGQFVYYGVIDVVLLQAIDRKVGLTALMCKVSEKMNSPYPTILGTTKPWANYIRNILFDRKMIITPETMEKRGVDVEKSIVGGFVRSPTVGKHKWVVSGDVNSMYPLLAIAGSNMSPDTFKFAWELSNEGAEGKLKDFAFNYLHVGDKDKEQDETQLLNLVTQNPEAVAKLSALLKEANLAMAPNGAFFRKDRPGVIPGLVNDIYNERKVVKKQMFRKEQAIIRIREELERRKS